ncbi:hypothetical protein [Streptomyces sp. NPDC012756]|uniref:hypothetical protein n=1 Tax=Streptomyces sp. NPDC012756 TaxID=3364847 RepID=UPI0036BFD5C0
MVERGSERHLTVHNESGVVVIGEGNRVVNVVVPPVRSVYGEQVRRIAPGELLDREEELAELAAFCRSGDGYRWWRADAWAGKTALLSWFALHPPPGVRIVPFFVTARWGAQNDATAYVDVVLEQLAELAGEPLPPFLPAATRHARLLHLYGTAARACAGRGERLVLLVDGLDEDRGVTTGPDAHSIAALLPYDLPVLVSGRPNPPVPADVPEDHPLRDPAIVRILSPSPSARAIRVEAERELKRLLEGSGLPYELLALVTAAGGGLTADDLVELTGDVPYRVADVLRTGPGRTFAVRDGAYLLAHEELAARAREMLGARELARRRAVLHDWANEWRARGWPEGTPGYLLRGYVPMLREAGDADRLTDCALDVVRHDRMLAATGGDGAALTEVRTASEAVLARGDAPGPAGAMLRLAVRRDRLEQRGGLIPPELAAGWAAVGEVDRAVALARAPGDERAAVALCAVALKLLERGERERAAALVDEAEALALRDREAGRRDAAAAAVAGALVALGALDRAERRLRRIGGEPARSGPLTALIRAFRAAGEDERALGLVRAEPDPRLRAGARTETVRLLAAAGRAEEAARAAREPDPNRAVRAVVLLRAAVLPGAGALLAEGLREWEATEPQEEEGGLRGELVEALVAVGERARARVPRHGPFGADDTVALAAAFARAGDWYEAWALVDALDTQDVERAVLRFARVRLDAGDLEAARELGYLGLMRDQEGFWESLAEAHLARREPDDDEELAGLMSVSRRGFAVLGVWARRWIERGEAERALASVGRWTRLVEEAQLTAPLVGAAAEALHDAGRTAEARALLLSAEEAARRPPRRVTAVRLARTARALAAAGLRAEALDLLDAFPPDGPHEDHEEADLVAALLVAGRPGHAEAHVWAGAGEETWLLAWIVTALITEGTSAYAERLIQQEHGDEVVAAGAVAYADTGDTRRAGTLLERLSDGALVAVVSARLALALDGQGRAAEAAGRLDRAVEAAREQVAVTAVMLPDVVRAQLALGRRAEAAELLATATRAWSMGYGREQPSDLPGAWVVAGEYDRAVRLVRTLPPDLAERGLLAVAVDLARAGRFDHAEALLAGLHHLGPACAGGYTVLAAEHPDPAAARRLTALALHLGPWFEALPAVLGRAPETVPLVLEEAARLRRALEV